MWVQFPVWVIFFALRVLFPAPCTYIPCTSLHGCLQLPCTYIPCVGDLFAFTMLFPPPSSYIPYISLCTSLHGSQHGSPPLPCTYIPSVVSIFYMGDLFALRELCSPPCTSIPCISLCGSPPLLCTYIPCIPYKDDLFALRAQSPPPFIYPPSYRYFPAFPAWFPAWVPTTLMYLHSLHGFNSLCGQLFCTKGTVPSTMYLHSLHFPTWFLFGSPPLICTYIPSVPCVSSFPCMGNLTALMNSSRQLPMYIISTKVPPNQQKVPTIITFFPAWLTLNPHTRVQTKYYHLCT